MWLLPIGINNILFIHISCISCKGSQQRWRVWGVGEGSVSGGCWTVFGDELLYQYEVDGRRTKCIHIIYVCMCDTTCLLCRCVAWRAIFNVCGRFLWFVSVFRFKLQFDVATIINIYISVFISNTKLLPTALGQVCERADGSAARRTKPPTHTHAHSLQQIRDSFAACLECD